MVRIGLNGNIWKMVFIPHSIIFHVEAIQIECNKSFTIYYIRPFPIVAIADLENILFSTFMLKKNEMKAAGG